MRVVKLFYSSVLMTVFLGCKPVNSNSESSINNQSKSVENTTSEEQAGDTREDGVEDIYILSESGADEELFDLLIADLEQEEKDFNTDGLQLAVRVRTPDAKPPVRRPGGPDIDTQPVVRKPILDPNIRELTRKSTIRISNKPKPKAVDPESGTKDIVFDPAQSGVNLEFPSGDVLNIRGGNDITFTPSGAPSMVVARSSLEIPADMRLFGKSDSLNYLVPVSRKLDVKIKGGSLTQWDEASGVFQGGIGGRNIRGTILQRIPETPVPTKNLLRRKILRFFRNKAAKPSSKPTKLDFDNIGLPTAAGEVRFYGFKQKYGDVSTVDPANAGRATLGRDGTNILEKRQLEDFIKQTNENGEYNVRLIDDGDYRVFSIEKTE